MEDVMDFSVSSTKGRQMMHYKNKLFTKSKETVNADGAQVKVYWSCSRRGCRGSVNYAKAVDPNIPDDVGVIGKIIEKEHDDLCTTTSVDIIHRIARSEIIRQAGTGASLAAVRALVLDPLIAMHPLAGATMQTATSLQSSFSRAARAALPPIPPAGNMSQLVVPREYQVRGEGEHFLMFQDTTPASPDGLVDSTILAFCTLDFFHALCESTVVFINGTFNICPAGFEQYLTLHTIRGPSLRLIPAMYCVLTNKSEAIYNRLFELIKNKAAELGIPVMWQNAITDYEPHMETALSSSFAGIMRHGCHFHFTMAVYKYVCSILAAAYKNEASGVRVVVQKVFALAFLEPNSPSDAAEAPLDSVWRMLREELLALQGPLVPKADLLSFISYFETEWMANRLKWNLFDSEDHRVNNDLEMWHVTMNQAINRKDNLWKFVKSLSTEQGIREEEAGKIARGVDQPPQRRTQRQKEELLAAAKTEYSMRRITPMEYVTRLSYKMGH